MNLRQKNILPWNVYFMILWYFSTQFMLFFLIVLSHMLKPLAPTESLWMQQWTWRIWDSDVPAHEAPWPFHPIIVRPRWTCHMWHASVLLLENPQVLFLSFSFVWAWVIHTSPKQCLCSTAGISGLSLSHFLLIVRGGAFALLGQRDTLKLFIEKKAV